MPHRVNTSPLAIFLLLGLSACTQSGSEHSYKMENQDGVATALNSGSPLYEGAMVTFERVLELRADPDIPESTLYAPEALTTDGTHYYVADTNNHRIAVYDSGGKYLRQIGRGGEGPGELLHPGAEFPAGFSLRDGILSVFVRGRGLTVRYQTNGVLIDELSVSDLRPRGIVLDETDQQAAVVWEPLRERRQDLLFTSARISVLNNESGGEKASITTPAVPTAAFVTVPSQERPAFVPITFSSWPDLHLLDSAEVLMSPGLEPILYWYDLSGRLIRQAVFDIRQVVTDADRTEALALLDTMIERSTDPRRTTMWQSQKTHIRFAERKAPWGFVRVDQQRNYYWLIEPFAAVAIGKESAVQRPFRAMLVNGEGEYLGDATLPYGIDPVATRIVDGRLLTFVTDPRSGEPIPTVFQVQPTDSFVY